MPINQESLFNEVLEEVSKDGMQLINASIDLKDHLDICMAAVSQNWAALQFCSERLRDDFNFCLKVLEVGGCRDVFIGNSSAWNFISERLRNESQFVLEAMQYGGLTNIQIPEHLLCETYFMEHAVRRNGSVIIYACPAIQHNRRIVLEAAKNNGFFLSNDSFSQFLNDKEVALEACCSNTATIKYISDELKKEISFIAEVVKRGANFRDLVINIDKEILFSEEVFLNREALLLICINSKDFFPYLLAALNYGKLDPTLLKELEEPCSNWGELGIKQFELINRLFEKAKIK
jgi:hypothetical protein